MPTDTTVRTPVIHRGVIPPLDRAEGCEEYLGRYVRRCANAAIWNYYLCNELHAAIVRKQFINAAYVSSELLTVACGKLVHGRWITVAACG